MFLINVMGDINIKRITSVQNRIHPNTLRVHTLIHAHKERKRKRKTRKVTAARSRKNRSIAGGSKWWEDVESNCTNSSRSLL
ncbi:MAG: hypothetical protein ACKESB_03910 [Candidatus Hodgkinia cicadicola]